MWHPALLVLGGKVLTQQLHKFLHGLSCCEILTEKCTSQTYLAQSEHVWKKHGPPHSFIHRPSSSSVSLPPSVSAWHAGSLPDHQPVSNDSLVWRRGRTANLHSSQLPVCKPVYIHYSQPSMNALKAAEEERQLPVIAAASDAGALQSVNCRVSGFLSRCHH